MTKCYYIIFVFLLNFYFAAAQVNPSVSDIKRIEEQVKATHAPDHRTAIFKVVVDEQGPLKIQVETTDSIAAVNFTQLVNQARIQAEVAVSVLPSKELGDKLFGVASLSVSNNRLLPSHTAEMVTQMTMGTPVEVLKKQRGWYLVRTPDNYLSWTEGSGITLMTKTELNNWHHSQKLIYTSAYGKALVAPQEDAAQVSDVIKGNIMKLVGFKGKYAEVQFPDGRLAYISRDETTNYASWLTTRKPDAQHILASAKSMLGLPYLWGGTSVKGVDCSGFTRSAYFLNGIILPRDASQQALVGQQVDVSSGDSIDRAKAMKNLLPGDLLFFGFSRDGSKPRVTHTAIYMGNGKFIQSAGMVKISSINPSDPDFDAHNLLSARRMLTAIGQENISPIKTNRFYSPR